VSAVAVAVPEPGRPVVAFSHAKDGVTLVFVWRWTGSEWEPMGPPHTGNELGATSPALALGKSGTLYLSLLGITNGPYNIYVARWDGTSWDYVGDSVNGTIHVGSASVAFSIVGNDRPHIAWPVLASGGSHVLVRRWSGSVWEDAAPGVRFNAAASTSDPSLAVDASGTPYAAFAEFETNTVADRAARYNNGTFEALGAPFSRAMDPTLGATTPAIAIDAAGRVVLVSKVVEQGFAALAVRRFEANAWKTLGENLTAQRGQRKVERVPALVLTAKGRPVVAFDQSDGTYSYVHVYRSNL